MYKKTFDASIQSQFAGTSYPFRKCEPLIPPAGRGLPIFVFAWYITHDALKAAIDDYLQRVDDECVARCDVDRRQCDEELERFCALVRDYLVAVNAWPDQCMATFVA